MIADDDAGPHRWTNITKSLNNFKMRYTFTQNVCVNDTDSKFTKYRYFIYNYRHFTHFFFSYIKLILNTATHLSLSGH